MMNELLQHHGCSKVFTIPEGLRELMADISREVLRDQPPNIYEYIANYLSALLVTREHGILAVRILDDLCDCRPSVSEHLMQMGIEKNEASSLAQIVKEEIEGFKPEDGKEKVKEIQIVKRILAHTSLDEEMAARVCQVARNAYRDYWHRKKFMEKHIQDIASEPWERAALRTIELYKRTKPSLSELERATQRIQAAYRGYYVRRNLPQAFKQKKQRPADQPGPPPDIAGSREIDLGPVINLQVFEEDTEATFDEVVRQSLHLNYDPMRTITHIPDADPLLDLHPASSDASRKGVSAPTNSVTAPLDTWKSQHTIDEENLLLYEPPPEVPLEATSSPIPERRKNRFPPSGSGQKISFGAVIHLEDLMDVEEADTKEPRTAEVEVSEELAPEPVALEDAPEIMEDIRADSASEYSASGEEGVDSAPLSAASTAPPTDVDTAAEDEVE